MQVTEAEYHLDLVGDRPSLSASIATILCNSTPLHAWTAHPKLGKMLSRMRILNPDFVPEDTKPMDIGKIAHALLLEGVSVAEVLDFADWRKDAAKEARDAARAAGKIPILAKDYPAIEAMVLAAHIQLEGHREASNAFTGGRPEQTITWEMDGVLCKARIDWLHNNYRYIDDYKTAASANPEQFTRNIFRYGYDIQESFYVAGVKAVFGVDAQFRFIVQEKEPPYALSVISLGPDVKMLAEKKIMYAVDTWRECLKSGRWPAYPNRICWASLPAYEESRWLTKEMTDVHI